MTDDELENKLADVRLSGPSEKLDDRMDALFARGRRRPRTPWLLPLFGAVCALGVVLIVFSHRRPVSKSAAGPVTANTAVTVVRPHCTQSQNRLVRLLLEPQRSLRPLPEFTVSIVTR